MLLCTFAARCITAARVFCCVMGEAMKNEVAAIARELVEVAVRLGVIVAKLEKLAKAKTEGN